MARRLLTLADLRSFSVETRFRRIGVSTTYRGPPDDSCVVRLNGRCPKATDMNRLVTRRTAKSPRTLAPRAAVVILCVPLLFAPPDARAQAPRPKVGVAFGGGSARGIAHIGIIQWFEENHIPIDTAAGTSMGGLIGGAWATGMSAAELRAFVNGIDWDTMFGSSSFPFKNLRRKEDARSYPSRLEFGVKRGIVPPTSLNDGQQVDLLLARLTAPYYGIRSFDELPTPFRVVAVDLRAGEKVVLDSGSFATALRSTMSLPAVFPPVERDGKVLVDGGALNNIPADVVRDQHPSVVIAVSVGYAPTNTVNYSLFGLLGQSVDAMMKATTEAALKHADLVIAVDVEGFGSLDWRRADELIARGYQAAEKRRDELLKYRVSDEEWQVWLAQRQSRRKTEIPQPAFLKTEGFAKVDAAFVERTLTPHLDKPIDIPLLEYDLASMAGLDRYQSVTWQMVDEGGRSGLLVRASPKVYAPPFLMLGLNIENTTSEDFRVRLAARYLTFDKVGSGSELRIDGAIGADPNIAVALYNPIGGSRLFARSFAGAHTQTFGIVNQGAIVAEYRENRLGAGGGFGVNLSRTSEVAGGFGANYLNADVRTGDPGLPKLAGSEVNGELHWVVDTQDSPVLPSRGTRAVARLDHIFDAPQIPDISRTNKDLTQFELYASTFHSLSLQNRVFAVLAGGTSFDGHPLPTDQFTLGFPYLLDAFGVGERRGDHYAVLTLGAAHRVTRLPDFLGGPVFASAWFQNGSAFNSHEKADINSQLGLGIVADTLVGPVLIGGSFGFDGAFRLLFGVGRIFR
jgi:NTE family protein